MTAEYEKLKTLLKELFQLDQPDLDFGLYRILHAKRHEVTEYLEKELLPQVKQALLGYKTADKAEINKELAKAIEQARSLGAADPETLPKVQELRAKLENEAVDLDALENEVYDHLFSFFKRYYSEGDFLTKRVYKRGVYSIPYEGEEVLLHWANKDQYYIKTSEYLRDYAFRLRRDDQQHPVRVHFRLSDAAEGEHGYVKTAEDKDRVFILSGDNDFISEEDNDLVIRFEYRQPTINDWPDDQRDGKTKSPAQKDLIALAVKRVLATSDTSLLSWINELGKSHLLSNGETANYSVFEAHLKRYVGRNTFDYFIHEDLGTFLRRELDFFIKNEVVQLDDVEGETVERIEQYLSKIAIIRNIAGKIIAFLKQLEDFQLKLWLKKKFVVETRYCITLDRIADEFYPEIASNDAQRAEWVKLFAIDKEAGDLTKPQYSEPLTPEFLRAHPSLVIDTGHFPAELTQKILASLEDMDATVTGCLFAGDGFQAARLANQKWQNQISCFYSDPPFNLGANADFAYKTDYQDSTWLTLLRDRLRTSESLLKEDGLIFVRCDYHGSHLVRDLLQSLGYAFKAEILINRSRNEAGSPNKMESTYEHLFMFGMSDAPIAKYTVPRSLASRKWTGFLMAGDRNPPERTFLGRTLYPPAGQHFSLRQQKVDKILGEFCLRLKCRNCSCLYYEADDDQALERQMRSKKNQSSFYDIKAGTLFHGVRTLNSCKECGSSEYRVEYLGRDEVFINDNWLDIPSYSRRWGFATENSEELLDRVTEFTKGGVLDLFAGSGTTAAVAIKKSRRWLTAEMGSQVNDVILPRLKAVLHGEPTGISRAQGWKGGGAFKYCLLESYEDTLNNLQPPPSESQQLLLNSLPGESTQGFREAYLLNYMLDVETRENQSLLNVRAFNDPTAYKLKIKRPGSDENPEVDVDLLETFNWLIGLNVKRIGVPQSFNAEFERDTEKRLRLAPKTQLKPDADGPFWFRPVTGTTTDGRKTLVIWRKLTGDTEKDNLILDEWFMAQGYAELDVIYVNGTNNLENLKGPDDRWKVRLIEEDFHRLMFEKAE